MTAARAHDELFTIWSAARAESNLAYEAWCSVPGHDAYVVYRAAEDRADAAEVALVAAARPLRGGLTAPTVTPVRHIGNRLVRRYVEMGTRR